MSKHKTFIEELVDSTVKEKLIEEIISELSSIGETLEYSKDDEILKSGEINKYIFFLLSGELKIIVENETVAKLKNRGDLVGEMSIVSRSETKAGVVANCATTMLRVSISKLRDEEKKYDLMLYKVFCLALSEKLENTNIKAKNFEKLNKSLEQEVAKRTVELQNKNSALEIGLKKLENMYSEDLRILKKLSTIENDYLTNAIELSEGNEQVQKPLYAIQSALNPITKLKREKELMTSKNVLVIEPNSKQRNMIKMALGGTGVNATITKSSEEGIKRLESDDEQIDTIFLSTDSIDVADYIKTKNIHPRIVLMTEEESKDYISKIKDFDFLSNIIATKEDDRAYNIKSITTTMSKMASGDIFGLDKYLNWGAEVKEYSITSSKDRSKLNNKVIEELSNIGIRASIRSRISTVIEELLMNAIYDAPVDEDGKSLYNNLPRTVEVNLNPEQAAKLKVATDGLFLAVSVEDPFGAFKKETIFKYLENNYYQQNFNMNKELGKGGAGRGLFMITENSELVIYNIAPKSRTEVVALFDLNPRKDKKTTSLHYFEI